MTQRTRYFLAASGLIVTVGLGAGLMAVYTTGMGSRRAGRLAELSYVPGDVTAVAYADVRRIMDSEFRQKLRAVLPTGEAKDRLFAETGIDVERDIDSATAGLSPQGLSDAGPVVLLRGRFDAARIEGAAARHGATPEDYKGKRLLRAPSRRLNNDAPSGSPSPVDDGESGIAFLEPGLVALGRMASLRQAIDTAERGDDVTTNADLMTFVNQVATSGDAWVAGRVDAVSGHSGWSGPVKDHLSGIEWFAVSAGIDRAVNGRIRLEARDAKAAEELRAVLNGGLAMARMMAGKDARLTALLDSVKSTGTGTTMELSFTVPPEALDFMTTAHGGVHHGPGADHPQPQ
jgi:hypothetical protein